MVGQFHHGTYIVYGKIKVADFMEDRLEDVMRKRIAGNTYNSYKNEVYNYYFSGDWKNVYVYIKSGICPKTIQFSHRSIRKCGKACKNDIVNIG